MASHTAFAAPVVLFSSPLTSSSCGHVGRAPCFSRLPSRGSARIEVRASGSTSKEKKKDKKSKVLELTAEEEAGWMEVRSYLMDLGYDEKRADKMIKRAFGWDKAKYWRSKVNRETPSMSVIEERLNFIDSTLGLTAEDEALKTMLKKFPEILRLPLYRMEENITEMQEKFPAFQSKQRLLKALEKQPEVLGFDVDCSLYDGSCMGECSRCWLRLE